MPGRWQEILVPLAGFIPTYTKRSKTAAALRQRLFGFYLLKTICCCRQGVLGLGSNIDAATFAIEEYAAVYQREDGVIAPHANTLTGLELGATLAYDDVTCDNGLTAKLFNAEALAAGIATVANGTLTFLMCHD